MRGGGLQVCGGVNDWNVQYTNSTVLISNSKTILCILFTLTWLVQSNTLVKTSH